MDPRVVDGVLAAARDAVDARAASAVALVLSVFFALFVCSSAFVAAGTALNVVLEARDDRSLLRRRLDGVRDSVLAIVLAVAASIAVFLGGDLATELFGVVGLGGAATAVWAAVRYPVAAVLAVTTFAWLYYSAPRIPRPRWRWITLGAAVGVALWLLASVALFLFAAQSGSYNETYGTFATAILLVVWRATADQPQRGPARDGAARGRAAQRLTGGAVRPERLRCTRRRSGAGRRRKGRARRPFRRAS